jgi:lysophospholipase L1-like esterase
MNAFVMSILLAVAVPGAVNTVQDADDDRAALASADDATDAERTALAAFADRIRAPGAPVADPQALSSFFAALNEAQHERVNVAFFGNSLIAADRIVNVVRSRLVDVAGAGGRGFVLADRMAAYGPRDRTARSASGWTACTLGDPQPLPASRGVRWGVPGVVHVSNARGARSAFSLTPLDEVATIFGAVDDARGGLRARFDNGPWQCIVADDVTASADVVHRLLVPPNSRVLELEATGARAVVHGVALERDQGGVVVDTFGVPAVDATLWLGTNERTLSAHLAARAPDLAVLMLGGNETKRLAWHRRSIETIEADLRGLIQRVRDVDHTACLVIGPIDAVTGKDTADPWRQRPQLQTVNDLHRRVAHDEGCAFFDLFEAMGGKGSLKRMHAANALHDDLVHPRGRGLDVLGHLLAEALLTSWKAERVAASP